jgi:hypothetical protein
LGSKGFLFIINNISFAAPWSKWQNIFNTERPTAAGEYSGTRQMIVSQFNPEGSGNPEKRVGGLGIVVLWIHLRDGDVDLPKVREFVKNVVLPWFMTHIPAAYKLIISVTRTPNEDSRLYGWSIFKEINRM